MRIEDRILTLHPQGKQGVNIERRKYDVMRRAILAVSPRRAPGVAFADLPALIRGRLPAREFPPEAGVRWYVTTVKLDLEARGELVRVPGSGRQRLVRAEVVS